MILMLIKYQSLKKDHMVKIIHLYTLLNIIKNDVMRPLCLKLSQMTGYINKFNKKNKNKNKNEK